MIGWLCLRCRCRAAAVPCGDGRVRAGRGFGCPSGRFRRRAGACVLSIAGRSLPQRAAISAARPIVMLTVMVAGANFAYEPSPPLPPPPPRPTPSAYPPAKVPFGRLGGGGSKGGLRCRYARHSRASLPASLLATASPPLRAGPWAWLTCDPASLPHCCVFQLPTSEDGFLVEFLDPHKVQRSSRPPQSDQSLLKKIRDGFPCTTMYFAILYALASVWYIVDVT